MSTTIDERVVEMRFDNRQFEQNVQTSMSTLEKLKQSLNLTGASKGLENINTAAKGINLSGITTAVETVGLKFNALFSIADQVLRNITNSAYYAGKRIVSSLTIDPIKTGFQEYETQINAVQTILANTQSKGTTLDDVNAALDELNTYADKTIYNFTQMTRNIGTFTAAGVDLDTSVKSIQGIANLAAVSGSTSQQASNAMYQLSQALAAGRVSLMDWNSVVNAGMGGQVFQDALKRTATVMGTDVDALIKKYGSFRESLTQGQWLTTEVLTKTLEQFTMAAEEGSAEWENFKKSLMDEGYTEQQAIDILKMANTATDAATKVKTFTQLFDTLKEAAQSGWTQTWEIIVGDFEEAKDLLTNISNVIGEMINNSAKVRNELLQGWKDAGGRADLIEGFSNIFDGIMNIIKPIKEAFRDIFPPLTVEQLTNFTKGFKELTAKFEEFGNKHGDKIKSTFKGIFSVIDIVVEAIKAVAGGAADLIKNFAGIEGGILGVTGAIGDWITGVRDSITEGNLFKNIINEITGFLTKIIDKIKEFGTSLKEGFEAPGYSGFVGLLKGIFDIIAAIGKGVSNVFSSLNFSEGLGAINSLFSAGFLVGATKLTGSLSKPFEALSDAIENIAGEDGALGNIKGILDDVRGCFEAYQNNLQAETLKKIAVAIAILAGSILIISSIDGDALNKALGGLTVLFAELLGAMAIFGKITTNVKGAAQSIGIMIGMSAAIAILAVGLKTISTIDPDAITRSLIAIGVLMAELSIFLKTAEFSGKMKGTAVGIVILSSAMLILAKAVEDFGVMQWGEITKGLTSIGILLGELAIFSKLTGNAKHVISTATSMVILGAAMKIFASVMKDFKDMQPEEISRGLKAMGLTLAELVIAMNLMPRNTVSIGVGLIAIGAAMKILASTMKDFGGMQWGEIGRGLTVLGLALAELVIALHLMNGTAAGSAALIIAAGALAIITPVLKSLGKLTWGEIAKGLISIAGAFAVVGIAGLLLTPLVPTLVSLAGAMALFGLSTLAIGVGITAIAAGFTALATAGTAGATAFVASLSVIIVGILDLIPSILNSLKNGLLAICSLIIECAPEIAHTIMVVLAEVISSLATYMPQIVDSLITFFIGIIDALATRLPELITSAVNLIGAFFKGIVDALSGIDTTNLLKGIVGVGLLAGLMFALSAVVKLIPGAMTGVIGMGIVIAELALVLAAVGALAQIPGLSWLIEEGGNFLQTVGTAIGQFVGGIVGGFAGGISSSFPQIGSDLSAFMTNAKPFIDGAKNIDASMMTGVQALADTILTLTKAEVLDGITSWITGGSSLSEFATQLVPFGQGLKDYADAVAGIDSGAVGDSATAAKALVELANNLPNSGGIAAWFAGENDMSTFATQLVPFGKGLKDYADAVAGIDSNAVTNSATAAKSLSELANNLPNSGGMASWFAGENDISEFGTKIVPFGKGLKEYSDAVTGLNAGAISIAVTSTKNIVGMIKDMSGLDSSGVNALKNALETLGNISIDSFVKAFDKSTSNLTSIGSNMAKSIKEGFESKVSSLRQSASDIVTKIIDALDSKSNSFNKSGVELISNLIKGINSKKSKISETITSTLKSVESDIRGYYDNFYNAGSYLVTGFANGISANSYKAAAKARAMAIAARDAAESALGIHSPSKVFYQIGDYTGQGFVNALSDYESKSFNAGSSMAKSARDGLNSAIGKITDVLNGNADMQPTIRPVLDLSEVTAGAGSINRLLNTSPSVGVMSNIRAINSMMSNKNDPNIDVISAIKDLGRKIGNTSGDTYNINGVTYDDGSNIVDAVQTLVRAAKIERRT